MCVTFLAFGDAQRPICERYKLVLFNNRDEYYDRNTTGLHWERDILAGRDENAPERGTWLGVSRRGDVGNLLSITEPAAVKHARGYVPSRGRIVDDFLRSDKPLLDYCSELEADSVQYHGFQFVGLKRSDKGGYELATVTNGIVPKCVVEYRPAGIYGFGNSPTSNQLRKVDYGRRRFVELLDRFHLASSHAFNVPMNERNFVEELDDEPGDRHGYGGLMNDAHENTEKRLVAELLEFGADTTNHFPDPQLQMQTAMSDEMYRPLCSLYVQYPDELGVRYGTRSHTVILVDTEDNVTVVEHRMATYPTQINDAQWNTVVKKFQIS